MGLIDEHLAWCTARNLRPTTIRCRGYALKRTARVVGPLDLAEPEILGKWFADLELSPEARRTELSHVRSFYRWAVAAGCLDVDPSAQLPIPRVPRRVPRPMPDNDLAVALASAPEPVRAWLVLAAYAGLRACEIAGLHADDVRRDLDPPVLVIREGKGGHQRVIPLHPEALDALNLHHGRGYVFRRPDHQPFPAYSVSAGCNRFLHSIGITATLHQARHWFATSLYQSTLDLRLTQEMLGHRSPTTTAGYAAWVPSQGAEAVVQLRLAVAVDEQHRG